MTTDAAAIRRLADTLAARLADAQGRVLAVVRAHTDLESKVERLEARLAEVESERDALKAQLALVEARYSVYEAKARG